MTIELSALELGYGTERVVGPLTGAIASGRITALVGPNASGKSTLIRGLVGALAPMGGGVKLGSTAPHRLRGSALARAVTWVPQRHDVAAPFTTREVVAMGRYRLGPDAERLETALAALDLETVADRPVPELSAGQQQRVALARAVAQFDPGAAWILDEPTAALDLRHARDVYRLLRRAADGGGTVVVALHDLAAAARLADDVWLLHDGTLAATGPAATVLQPEPLEGVFGLEFSWATSEDGLRVLVPRP